MGLPFYPNKRIQDSGFRTGGGQTRFLLEMGVLFFEELTME
ncbi:hypothetical protein SLEP1_g10185 [Rubroshorea leprosula]|uniref:Uncharacterized protein n=1 Tax=Rubroshorea leprosula TaxID=152421 RepID=A0AAV5IH53_9ROSI|nr:hypothetical protein SLEP1_g10185 [Rubroshorea leprosula]